MCDGWGRQYASQLGGGGSWLWLDVCGVRLFGGENGRGNLRAEDGMGDGIWGSSFWRELPQRVGEWKNADEYLEICIML